MELQADDEVNDAYIPYLVSHAAPRVASFLYCAFHNLKRIETPTFGEILGTSHSFAPALCFSNARPLT